MQAGSRPLPAMAPRERRDIAPRDFARLTEEGEKELQSLIQEFRQAPGDQARLVALDRIDAGFYGREWLELAREILAGEGGNYSAEVRARAVEMLAGNTSAAILPLLELARKDAGEAERIQIVMAAARVRDRKVVDFIAGAFDDSSANVRFSGLDAADLLSADHKGRLFARAMLGRHSDVALAGLAELEVDASLASMPLILQGLSAPLPEVREETLSTLGFLLDEDFSDPEQAKSWWKENERHFDRDLNRVD
ncbi:HEAT repeat domain-containing protein [Luteolibacter marinus]|uniref:HEAT repeat domain-containing protein n=1 Tax=Luteolibacter marinus TaxID=2776705 RepID=UPI001867AF6B|nr:hypothetical protein [Luteolibacter marinus]